VDELRDYDSYTLEDPNAVKAAVTESAGVGKIGS